MSISDRRARQAMQGRAQRTAASETDAQPLDSITLPRPANFVWDRGAKWGAGIASYLPFTLVGDVGTVASKHIEFDLLRNADEYLYKDKGAAFYASDFECQVDCLIDSTSDDYGYAIVWALSNTIDDTKAWWDGTLDGLALRLQKYTTVCRFELISCADNTEDDSAWIAYDTRYYLTIVRSGAITTCSIYSDAARATLVEAITVTEASAASYRHLFGLNSWNSANNVQATGDVWNLDMESDETARYRWGHEGQLRWDVSYWDVGSTWGIAPDTPPALYWNFGHWDTGSTWS